MTQANPVSTTLYTVLDTTKNCRLISIAAIITWATTQPTPLEVVVTIDGNTLIYPMANPVSATWYFDNHVPYGGEWSQVLSATIPSLYRSFMIEGRSVKVQVRITWATTQPTPLVCRVKYAKIP